MQQNISKAPDHYITIGEHFYSWPDEQAEKLGMARYEEKTGQDGLVWQYISRAIRWGAVQRM